MFEDRLFVAVLLALLGVAAAGLTWFICTVGARVVVVKAPTREAADAAMQDALRTDAKQPLEEGVLTGGWQVLSPPCDCGSCILFKLPDGRSASVRYFLTVGDLGFADIPDVLHVASDTVRDALTRQWAEREDHDEGTGGGEHPSC